MDLFALGLAARQRPEMLEFYWARVQEETALRQKYEAWAAGLPADVTPLMSYRAPAGKSPALLTVLEFCKLPLMQTIADGNYKETMLLLARDAEVPAPYEDIRRWLKDIGRIKDLPIFIVNAVHPNEIGHLSVEEYKVLGVSAPHYVKRQERRWPCDITPDCQFGSRCWYDSDSTGTSFNGPKRRRRNPREMPISSRTSS